MIMKFVKKCILAALVGKRRHVFLKIDSVGNVRKEMEFLIV